MVTTGRAGTTVGISGCYQNPWSDFKDILKIIIYTRHLHIDQHLNVLTFLHTRCSDKFLIEKFRNLEPKFHKGTARVPLHKYYSKQHNA